MSTLDYDPMEFSDLPENRKEIVRNNIDQMRAMIAQTEDFGVDLIEVYAKKIFDVIAPHRISENQSLLTDTKDYNKLRALYTVADASAGLFVMRSWLAHFHWSKRVEYGYHHTSLIQSIADNGYGVVRNFMGTMHAQNIREHIVRSGYPIAVHKGPGSTIDHVTDKSVRELITAMRVFAIHAVGVTNSSEQEVLMDQFQNSLFVQRLHNTPDDNDVQKVLHSDTYFPAFKMWYFPNAVTLHDGPFTFVPKSHLFSRGWAKFVYEHSQRILRGDVDEWRTYGHAEGSLRASMKEIESILGERPVLSYFSVPADTLVIANVFGFHARGPVTEPKFRDSIHGSLRPKLPFDV